MRGEEHHHGVIGDFVDEDVGHVGDDDAVVGRRIHVHGVGADAAEADHRAVLEARDDLAADAPPAGDQRIGVGLDGLDELFLALGGHLDDLGTDGVEGLALDLVGRVGKVVGDPALGLHHDFVLGVGHILNNSVG